MKLPNLNKEENTVFNDIINKPYMLALVKLLEDKYIPQYGIIISLDYLFEAIKASQGDVEKYLDLRLANKDITSKDQARKATVGNIFPSSILYLFLKAKSEKIINQNVFATTKTKNALFEKYVTINVGDETQKPDMDMVFYSLYDDGQLKKCIIMSLKTSLRERAGQTYKWKLLLEIASSDNPIKDKYNISFDVKNTPKVLFGTVNFYDEINNPQHRGMFKFFDGSFIGKPLKSDFIQNFSSLVSYLEKNL